MSCCKIHNVRFYKPKPEAIYCMSLQKSSSRLAVSRSDSRIEIWNLKESAFIERTIPGRPDDSIQDLAWVEDSRLFSVDLQGFLVEYDLYTLSRQSVLSVTGESAYCLAVHGSKIAVGTEQGYLNIFTVHEEDVMFDKFLDKQEGRILCVKYDPSGRYLVGGSVDAVRIWDVTTGHALHKMTTGRSEANKETIVWCLHVFDDLTIVSGDSRGKITFWDGKIGGQVESYQTHKADVLALIVSDDCKTLYCAGTDPNIISYVKINVRDGSHHKWVKSVQRKVHDHDIRGLVLCNGKLYAGGIDGYLSCSYYPPKTLIKYPPILQSPCVALAQKARLVLLRYTDWLEVWSLGQSVASEDFGVLQLADEPKRLLKLCRTVKENLSETIVTGAISSDGSLIFYSTETTARLFQFRHVLHEKPQLKPILLPDNCSGCIQAAFSSSGNKLALAHRNGSLSIYNLNEGPTLAFNIKPPKYSDTITFLLFSHSERYLLAGDPESNITVWKLAGDWKQHCKLPRYHSPPTAIAFKPDSNHVVAVYSDHKIVEYSLKTLGFTDFSRSLNRKHVSGWLNRFSAVRNITFDPRNPKIIILHDDANIVVINQEKPLPKTDAKIPKIESSGLSDSSDSFKSTKHAVHAVKKYKHLVHLEWLSNDELVAVEVSPLSLIQQLPPCFKENRFGTK